MYLCFRASEGRAVATSTHENATLTHETTFDPQKLIFKKKRCALVCSIWEIFFSCFLVLPNCVRVRGCFASIMWDLFLCSYAFRKQNMWLFFVRPRLRQPLFRQQNVGLSSLFFVPRNAFRKHNVSFRVSNAFRKHLCVCVWQRLCVKAFVCKSLCVYKCLRVKPYVCKSVCV